MPKQIFMEKSVLEDFMFMLPENPTNAEIERAYKLLAQWYHPDQNQDRTDWANGKMKELNVAKEILLDPNKRTLYLNALKNQRVHEKEQLGMIESLRRENLALRQALIGLQKRNNNMAALGLMVGAAMASKNKRGNRRKVRL